MSLLSRDATHNVEMIINFEGAEPESEEEKKIHAEVSAVLEKGPNILDSLQSYQGCEEYIRQAITKPGPENDAAAWNAVLPAVDTLKQFYDFSLELEGAFPKLLSALCSQEPKDALGTQQALAKQLADVFDFVLRFDEAKMVNPAIQNDFSYYRRTLNRMKLSKKDVNLKIRDELANRMSLFFAYPTPMMNALSETTAKFLGEDSSVSKEKVSEALALMANVCQHMVDIGHFENEQTNLFCLRAMTGAIVLYDHLAPAGAFHKKSPINMRGCVTVLKNFQGAGSSSGTSPAAGLLNAIRFTTKHLNDPETPSNIKQLLA